MTRHNRPHPAAPAPIADRSWEARATALRREGAANVAMLAAVVALLAALAGWIAVLGPRSGSVRGSPVFWLLALPVMAWTGPLLGFRRWAVYSLPLVLAAAPLAAGGAMEAARIHRDADLLSAAGLDTPFAMNVVLGICVAAALAGLVAWRGSSLPGGTRPAVFATPGSLPAGIYRLPDEAIGPLRLGSLAASGAVVNGVFFTIVALLDLEGERLAPIWPAILPASIVVATFVLVIGGTRGLLRRRLGAAATLRRGWLVGAGGAAVELLLVWVWPTDPLLKLAFSGFMLPMALLAAWGAHRGIRGLRAARVTES